MEVTNRQWCDFTVWTPEGLTIQRVVRDDDYWLWILPKLAEFWSYVVADVEPPKFKKRPQPPDVSKLIVQERLLIF